MEVVKSTKQFWVLGIFSLMPFFSLAQFFTIDGTYSRPESLFRSASFKDIDGSGLYAKNGGGLNLEFQSAPNIIGVGGSFSMSFFGVRDNLMMRDLGATDLIRTGAISSVNFGIGPVLNVPIIEDLVYWHLKLYGGFRFTGVPGYSLTYDPLDNRYLEVDYSSATNISLHYEFGSGVFVMFSDNVGVNLGVSYLGGTVNTFEYEYAGKGSKLISGVDQLNQTIDYLNFRVGLVLSR